MHCHTFRTGGRSAWARLVRHYGLAARVKAVAADTPGLRRVLASAALVLVGFIGLGTAGCSAGIRWQGYVFDPVYAKSRAENKLTFVYFRNWYAIECTEFEENVLKQPVVLEATADLACVPLDFDWDRPLADKWGIRQAPAFVIVDPAGRILARREGAISLEALLDAVDQAKEEFAPMTQPAVPP